MNFLQSWILWALPLALLPILIHLIHKRRHRVVEWGAMMFLLEGVKMSRGRQRLREILLLAARTLAILGLLLGIGRPIAGGWVGRMGGETVDSVVLIVDRSASMSEHVAGRPESKLEFGLRSVLGALEIANAKDVVVIDAVQPTESIRVDGPSALRDLTIGETTSSASDLPTAVETAVTYLEESEAGRSEIWIVSDAQTSDWRPEDGRWAALASALAEMPAGMRVRLSTFPSTAADNLAVRVERVRRERVEDSAAEAAELVLDIVVTRASAAQGSGDTAVVVPVAIEVGGARSSVDVELVGNEARLQGHRIPIDPELELGFGLVELTADSRPSDDRYWFVFGERATLETLIVRERDDAGRVLTVAAELPLDPSVDPIARQLDLGEDGVDLAEELGAASLLVWQAPLPEGPAAEAIDAFVGDGGYAMFLPPATPEGRSYRGLSWGTWSRADLTEAVPSPESWRADDDLLRTGADGTPLPVGEVELRNYCSIESAEGRASATDEDDADVAHMTLAALPGGKRVLVRASSRGGGVYFLGALPTPDSTNLASQGLVLVALVQRALQAAASERGSEIQQNAGPASWIDGSWRVASTGGDDGLFERSLRAGVLTDGESFIALNRPLSEDSSPPQTLTALEGLFGEVEVVATEATEGADAPGLLEEVWKVFMVLALVALLFEAVLCVTEGTSKAQREAAAAAMGGRA